MLVVERRAGSAVWIGDRIRIEVKSLVGGRGVKLAIEAPRSMSILREELVLEDLEDLEIDEDDPVVARAG